MDSIPEEISVASDNHTPARRTPVPRTHHMDIEVETVYSTDTENLNHEINKIEKELQAEIAARRHPQVQPSPTATYTEETYVSARDSASVRGSIKEPPKKKEKKIRVASRKAASASAASVASLPVRSGGSVASGRSVGTARTCVTTRGAAARKGKLANLVQKKTPVEPDDDSLSL